MRWRTSTRLVVALAAIAALTASAVSAVTFVTVRSYLAGQKVDATVSQARVNAETVQDFLTVGADGSLALSTVVRQPGSVHLVEANGVWFADRSVPPEQVPARLLQEAVASGAASQFTSVGEVPYLMVAFTLPTGVYVEAVPLTELDATLNRLLGTLAAASVAATLVAVASGLVLSRRLLGPLSTISKATRSLGSGDLGSRLAVTGDGDLDPIVVSFNQMADSLQARIERERRFSSDVSHELRSPLTAMHTSVDVLQDQPLSPSARELVELVGTQVARMEKLVVDLLEISRLDARADPQVCPVDLHALVAGVCVEQQFPPEVNEVPAGLLVASDPRYLARVLANLMVNAKVHAGAVTSVSTSPSRPGWVQVEVADAGPGLSLEEFAELTEPFARGKGASSRPGAGLGLSIVRLYVEQLGVTLRPSQSAAGAAMVLEVPLWFEGVDLDGGCSSPVSASLSTGA